MLNSLQKTNSAENSTKTVSDKDLIESLAGLGYLPKDFQGDFLYDLLSHNNHKIRLLAAKNIAKLNRVCSLEHLWNAFQTELKTDVRRELVSAIGRLRQPQNKHFLFEILLDKDPKVVCQAIRGLLVYEKDVLVQRKLKPLLSHPDESVRTIIYKEFFADKINFVSSQKKTKNLKQFEPTFIDLFAGIGGRCRAFEPSTHKYYDELNKMVTKRDTIYQWRRQYVRENKNNACPTLTANMGTGRHNVPIIRDDFGIRKLTPREC